MPRADAPQARGSGPLWGWGWGAESSSLGLLVASSPNPTPAALRFRASLRRRPRLLRGPGQGRKLARPLAGPAPLGWAGCSLELARHLRAESGSRVSRPVTLSGFLPHSVCRPLSGVSLSPPALSAFPLLGLSREPRSAVNRPSRDSKRSFVFPRGQQPNASLVFRNKADIQWGGGRR